ncbi:hypothetical protein LUZ61_020049 [Rhynchospora tenuis]|uniref:Uncharacterized protein n=1 Tax=Rhynchospora tenuis TaxID=198213 RepID=A0AAD6ENE8_9POAL|nr:hypothetical protein LUZ61_020049 [Rhynchospora tenuis]
MKAPCSPFAKISQYTHSYNGIYKHPRGLVGPSTRIKRQLIHASPRFNRSCISSCLSQRHSTLHAAAVTVEQVQQVGDEELLHAAALLDADDSAEAIIEKGCVYVYDSFAEHFVSGGKVITMLVEAIDVYLIGTVMLVFGMGLYELFICNLDIAKTSSYGSNLLGLFRLPERPKWLAIKSVNELKTKLGHVIVMVLLIGLFENSKKIAIETPTDLLCFAASILLSSGCLYLLSKLNHAESKEETDHAPEAS